MVIKVRVITIFFFLFVTVLWGQSNQQITDKNKELETLKSEVERLEKELASSKSSEIQSVDILTKIREQNLYLNKVINSLNKSEKELEKSALLLTDSLVIVESNVDRLRKGYAEYVKWLYMYKNNSYVDLIFSSGSIKPDYTQV